MNRNKLEAALDALVSRTLLEENLLLGIYRQHAQELESDRSGAVTVCLL